VATPETSQAVLRVEDLRLTTSRGVEVVDEVSFEARAGEVLAIVGESGCGKTSTALALLGHVRPGMILAGGSVLVRGTNVLNVDQSVLRSLRGARVAYVPQDASAALNPRRRIGTQMKEVMMVHGASEADTELRIRELITRIGLPDQERLLPSYPFELSGGQQQRVLIAMALACEPSVVVLDEPTTGLDVTTQAKVLDLLKELAHGSQIAFIYVTHDLAVVEQIADRIAVMYAGRIVEVGPCRRVLVEPAHPYTALLLESVPRIKLRHKLSGVPGHMAPPGARPQGCFFHTRCPLAVPQCTEQFPPVAPYDSGRTVRCWRAGEITIPPRLLAPLLGADSADPTLLAVTELTLSYGSQKAAKPIVHGISFHISMGECVALVGESGSGKTTTGRCIAGLHAPTSGVVELHGLKLAGHAEDRAASQRRAIQLVFQNPDRSLNPSHTVAATVERPLILFGLCSRDEARRQATAVLERVHLASGMLGRYPHELSGGEKQRVAIARALAAQPELLVCDEITSSLDVSIQASILNLLQELRTDGLAMLFITHNLAVVNSLADRTLVMEAGLLREQGPTSAILNKPQDEYTKALLSAAPDLSTAVSANVA
jgi:peptide/nickel transport system ATP-binding protein